MEEERLGVCGMRFRDGPPTPDAMRLLRLAFVHSSAVSCRASWQLQCLNVNLQPQTYTWLLIEEPCAPAQH